MELTRRGFLQATGVTVGGLALARTMPAFAADSAPSAPSAIPAGKRILVVIQLAGGNDGLNSVVPYGNGAYYDARPSIAIPQKQVLQLDGSVGLHPKMTGLKALYDQGMVAVVQGVGYPEPNHSHFRSMEIWQTAQPKGTSPFGWLGRYLDLTNPVQDNPLVAVALGGVNRSLAAARTLVPAFNSPEQFKIATGRGTPEQQQQFMQALSAMYRQGDDGRGVYAGVRKRGRNAFDAMATVQQAVTGYKPLAEYPKSHLAQDLKSVAEMASTGLATQIYYVTTGGFDEHEGEEQADHHGKLMGDFSDSLKAFFDDLAQRGLDDQVLVLAWSEFGRRVHENGSKGTDHGTAGPVFLVGKGVKGGLYGDPPSLANLDAGDLRYTQDFRQVYATVLEDWLRYPRASEILGTRFDKLGFVRGAAG